MGNSHRKPTLQNGVAWPLRYVADPVVAKVNPSYAAETGKTYPFVPMENVRENCEGLSGFENRILDAGGYTFFKNGDILFAKITPCTENGKIARVQRLAAEVGFGSTEFIVVSPSSSVDERFLYYQLTRGDVRALCASLMEGSTGRQRVPTSIFRKRIQIPVPPDRDEQSAIADALELIDSAVAAARESIAKTERLQKGLMQQLLTGRLKPDGTFRGEIDFDTDKRLGFFPKGWKMRKLRQVVRLSNGKSNVTSNLRDKADATFCYPVFGGNGMTGWSDRFLLKDATVVLGRVGEYCGVVHRTPAKAWITDNALYASEFPEPVDLGFLFFLLAHLRLNRWKAITGQPKITQSEILNIRVAIPQETNEQAEIAAKLDGVRQLIEAKHTKIAALQRLKKSLMQNLLTGRLRLPVASAKGSGP